MKQELIQDGVGNYLKITGDREETISDKIFSFQEIPGFLPLEIRRINGERECIYDISGRVSLARYLSETIFTEKDIRHILLQIFNMGERLEEYLLDSNGLVIHEEYLYVEQESGQVAGIYSPALQKGNVPALGHLLEYIMDKMNQEDKELVFFIYGMHKLTKGAGCTKALLKNYIKEGNEIFPKRTQPQEKMTTDYELPEVPEIHRGKGASAVMDYILPGILMAAGCLVIIILWRMGLFQKPLSGQTDWAKLAGASVFFLGVCGYGAWKTMPLKKHSGKNQGTIEYTQEKGNKKVCLIPRTGKGEWIEINTFPFRIGGDKKRANAVIHDSGGSKIHTQILQEGGNIFVLDEESDTGTYRNSERLVPWQKVRLNDGDFLQLAGNEYVVEITQSEYVI